MIEVELFELSKIESLRLIHLFTCSVAALFLIFIWKRVVSVDSSNKKEIGLLLLAGAFIMWVFMDAYRFTGFMKPGESSLVIKTFSAYNNAFFIAALPFFEGSFQWLRRNSKLFQRKTRWALAVLASNIVLVMLYSFTWKHEEDSGALVNYVDLFYSILTYLLLGYAIVTRILANVELRKSILMVVGVVLSLFLLFIQLAFSPLFKIVHYDLLSATAMISHATLAILLVAFGYEWLLEVRTSMVSEQNRTDEKIQDHLIENQRLQDELNLLRSELSNERSVAALSKRELEILENISESYTVIAERLFISRDTVITHKKNIETKLGISGKKNLEEFAQNKGLVNKQNRS